MGGRYRAPCSRGNRLSGGGSPRRRSSATRARQLSTTRRRARRRRSRVPRTRRPSVVVASTSRPIVALSRGYAATTARRRPPVRVVRVDERSQERRQQGAMHRRHRSRPRRLHVRRRVEVHPDADDHMIDPVRREPRLREDAARLAVVDEQVVRPLASQLLRRDIASSAHHGEPGGERQHAGVDSSDSHDGRRTNENRRARPGSSTHVRPSRPRPPV